VVIDETAAVGLNMGLGGGIMGAQGYQTYSDDTVNEQTRTVHAQAIRELVARDKNHPCVVLWSIANEPEWETPGAEDYFRPLFDVAREADPTRPVGFVNVMLAPHGKCRVSQFADVLMINRYYGWYTDTGDLELAEQVLEEELRGWATEGKPIIITEYGADTLPRAARGDTPAVDRGVPGRAPGDLPPRLPPHRRRRRRARLELRRLRDDAGIARVGGNKKGVFTRDRSPKAAAFALRRRWRGRDREQG
jgi:beta-glucuronidase